MSVHTLTEYRTLQDAFDHFNKDLFDKPLPQVFISLHRHAKARGYFAPERYSARGAKASGGGKGEAAKLHELALNPDSFDGRTDEEILSTLAHEMVHLWQQTHGTPPRRCYHDKEWARKMHEVGLMPSDTAAPGGKPTGQRVSHYILDGGAFQKSCKALLKGGARLRWQSREFDKTARAVAKKKADTKTKFTCPECEQNVWGIKDSMLICGACYEEDSSEPVWMFPTGGGK